MRSDVRGLPDTQQRGYIPKCLPHADIHHVTLQQRVTDEATQIAPRCAIHWRGAAVFITDVGPVIECAATCGGVTIRVAGRRRVSTHVIPTREGQGRSRHVHGHQLGVRRSLNATGTSQRAPAPCCQLFLQRVRACWVWRWHIQRRLSMDVLCERL